LESFSEKLGESERVLGEFHKSSGDGSLIEATTVLPPTVRIEFQWRQRRLGIGQLSVQARVHSFLVEILLEGSELLFQIGGGPE
jgi:hypothetical protein